MGPKIAPKQVQNRSELRIGIKRPYNNFLKPIWSRFGTALGGHFGAKIGVGSDLKSLRKEKPNLIRFRSRFWTHFGRFLTPHRRSKGRSKQQGTDYCRSFKIIDFPMEKHYFYYFERCPIAQKTSLFPSLKESWWKDAIKFRKSTLLGPPLAWIWDLTRPPKTFRKGFRVASCF